MSLTKTALTTADLESQAGFELPARETMLVTIVIGSVNILNDLKLEVKNNNVAVQVCAVVTALSTWLSTPLTCTIEQKQ
ncbi:MAG: hypothetical protein H0X16_00795 [Chloroflexi bacterium]|nr:hypothetical protein [Chloroflexota bacterium]